MFTKISRSNPNDNDRSEIVPDFVPDELRDQYLATPPPPMSDVLAAATSIAMSEARATVRARFTRDTGYGVEVVNWPADPDYRAMVEAEQQRLMSGESFDDLLRAAREGLRVERAREIYQKQQGRRRARDQFEKANTCPVCHVCNPIETGPIASRALLPGMPAASLASTPHKLRSCLSCFHIASQMHLTALASQPIAEDGRTRRDAVADAVASLGG